MGNHRVEAAVIGASLAGASAALRLARLGFSVLLCDKSTFPRRKICGEGLSIQGIEELRSLGLEEPLLELPNIPFYGFRFFERRRKSQIIIYPHKHGIGVRRTDLDTLLTNEARESGVETQFGDEPRISRLSSDEFEICTNGNTFRSRFLVIATGALSHLPQTLGVPTREKFSSRCGLSVALKHEGPHNQSTVDIIVDSNLQACSTPVGLDTTTLSLFCSNEQAPRLRPSDLPKLLDELCDRLGIKAVPVESPLVVSGLGRFEREPCHDSIFVVGDALRQLDPLGGMGMTHALVSARVAADTIAEILSTPAAAKNAAIAGYPTRLKQALKALQAYTALTYCSLANPVGRRILGRQKAGGLAKEVLLSMHRPSSLCTPYGLLAMLLIQTAGL